MSTLPLIDDREKTYNKPIASTIVLLNMDCRWSAQQPAEDRLPQLRPLGNACSHGNLPETGRKP